MATIIPPGIDEFRERFPEFASASDEAIQLALDDAAAEIGPTIWRETDYGPGIMFLAAHFLVSGMQQAGIVAGGTGTDVGEVGGMSLSITSESIGRISTSYGNPAGIGAGGGSGGMTPSDAALMSTVYGSRFLRLRKRNVPRLMII